MRERRETDEVKEAIGRREFIGGTGAAAGGVMFIPAGLERGTAADWDV